MTSPPNSSIEHRGLAIALVLASTMLFAFQDGIAKLIIPSIGSLETLWLRSFVVFVLTMPIVFWRQGRSVMATRHPIRQTMRGLSVAGSSLFFMAGLNYLPLADASAVGFIWPLLVTVLSVFILGEKVGIRRALATLVGFIGMLIIVRPGSGAFQMAAMFPILSSTLWAFTTVLTRGMMSTEHPETTIAWSATVMMLATNMFLPFYWVTPSWDMFLLALLIGVTSAIGHSMVIYAYSRARASVLAPFAYVQLVWASAWGYFLFGDLPGQWVIVGASIIVAAGIYTIHRERIRRGDD